MSRRHRVSRPSESGQDLVEFALLLPLLLLLLFGIIEFGIAVFSYNTTANVGREVARYGSVHPDATAVATFVGQPETFTGPPSDFSESIQRWTHGLSGNLTITPTLVAGGPLASTIQVTVTYEYRFLTGPIIEVLSGRRTLDLRTVTTMYTERPVN